MRRSPSTKLFTRCGGKSPIRNAFPAKMAKTPGESFGHLLVFPMFSANLQHDVADHEVTWPACRHTYSLRSPASSLPGTPNHVANMANMAKLNCEEEKSTRFFGKSALGVGGAGPPNDVANMTNMAKLTGP